MFLKICGENNNNGGSDWEEIGDSAGEGCCVKGTGRKAEGKDIVNFQISKAYLFLSCLLVKLFIKLD